ARYRPNKPHGVSRQLSRRPAQAAPGRPVRPQRCPWASAGKPETAATGGLTRWVPRVRSGSPAGQVVDGVGGADDRLRDVTHLHRAGRAAPLGAEVSMPVDREVRTGAPACAVDGLAELV